MIRNIIRVFSVSLVLCISGCSGNQFKDEGLKNVFTFGLFGYDDAECRKKHDITWMKSYDNGEYPSKYCVRYKYYTCHVDHYCNGDKKCEKDAAHYWTPLWRNAHRDIEKRVSISKKVCDAEEKRNSN